MAEKRQRLDHLLVERGLVTTGAKAQAMIMAGEVWVDGERAEKPGKKFPQTCELEIKSSSPGFVSRGGGKLEGALVATGVDVAGLVALDVGASTGGFTDCLLQRGAEKVYAVDVGKGLLDWKLRNDSRVVCMEGINARYLEAEQIPEKIDIIVVDSSFISLTKIMPAILPFLKEGGVFLPMVKPQFEVGKEQVPKGGVIKDPKLHQQVLKVISQFIYNSEMEILAIAPSPVKGPKGNQEFFIYSKKSPQITSIDQISEMIMRAIGK
jgi:23S rRNA (cytidine1920-2'-O)/16S rRNA (cytidine1409-2'-O)-methyltransferase